MRTFRYRYRHPIASPFILSGMKYVRKTDEELEDMAIAFAWSNRNAIDEKIAISSTATSMNAFKVGYRDAEKTILDSLDSE